MAVCYKKLWKLLIDKDMKKKDLCTKAGISSASVSKMGKNGHVTTEILLKICTALWQHEHDGHSADPGCSCTGSFVTKRQHLCKCQFAVLIQPIVHSLPLRTYPIFS